MALPQAIRFHGPAPPPSAVLRGPPPLLRPPPPPFGMMRGPPPPPFGRPPFDTSMPPIAPPGALPPPIGPPHLQVHVMSAGIEQIPQYMTTVYDLHTHVIQN